MLALDLHAVLLSQKLQGFDSAVRVRLAHGIVDQDRPEFFSQSTRQHTVERLAIQRQLLNRYIGAHDTVILCTMVALLALFGCIKRKIVIIAS